MLELTYVELTPEEYRQELIEAGANVDCINECTSPMQISIWRPIKYMKQQIPVLAAFYPEEGCGKIGIKFLQVEQVKAGLLSDEWVMCKVITSNGTHHCGYSRFERIVNSTLDNDPKM